MEEAEIKSNSWSPEKLENLLPREVLALAINIEWANVRRFKAFASAFQGYDEEIERAFNELAEEEEEHGFQLLSVYKRKFGGEVPNIDDWNTGAVIESVDLEDAEQQIFNALRPKRVFELALDAEITAKQFYECAASSTDDKELKDIFHHLSEIEGDHVGWLTTRIQELDTEGGITWR